MYIVLGVTLVDRPDGGWAPVLARNVTLDESERFDGMPVEYTPDMERHIRRFDGLEYFHTTDRNGNIIN